MSRQQGSLQKLLLKLDQKFAFEMFRSKLNLKKLKKFSSTRFLKHFQTVLTEFLYNCNFYCFRTYGQLKNVRLPKKMAGTGKHRGFGFVEYHTKKDAKVRDEIFIAINIHKIKTIYDELKKIYCIFRWPLKHCVKVLTFTDVVCISNGLMIVKVSKKSEREQLNIFTKVKFH